MLVVPCRRRLNQLGTRRLLIWRQSKQPLRRLVVVGRRAGVVDECRVGRTNRASTSDGARSRSPMEGDSTIAVVVVPTPPLPVVVVDSCKLTMVSVEASEGSRSSSRTCFNGLWWTTLAVFLLLLLLLFVVLDRSNSCITLIVGISLSFCVLCCLFLEIRCSKCLSTEKTKLARLFLFISYLHLFQAYRVNPVDSRPRFDSELVFSAQLPHYNYRYR